MRPNNKKKRKKKKKGKGKKGQGVKQLEQQPDLQRRAAAAAASLGAGVDPNEVQRIYNGFQSDLAALRKVEPEPLDLLRLKYSMLGKEDWWFIMDECVEQAAAQLKNDNFVVLDGFFGKARRFGIFSGGPSRVAGAALGATRGVTA